MRGVWRLHRARQWVRCRFDPPAVILLYHRVAELSTDPFLLAVTPRHFAEQLEAVQRIATPTRLADLVASLRQGRVPRRAVVVTFDDGYADNLEQARPILERYGVPATVFVATGQVGGAREFWWDELDRLILQPRTLPRALRLEGNGRTLEWTSDGGPPDRAGEGERGWHVERPDDPGPRHRLFRALAQLLYGTPTAVRKRLLDELAAWAGVPVAGRITHRALTPDEVVQLADGELIEVGAHTVTHPVLAALPLAEQRWEVRESKRMLEALLHRPVESFAYPHGSVTPAAVTELAREGYACGCASDVGAVFRRADPLRLPRIGVRDWDGDTMARHLRWWLGD